MNTDKPIVFNPCSSVFIGGRSCSSLNPLLSILFLAAAVLHAQGGAVEGKVVTTNTAFPVRKATVVLRAAPVADDQPSQAGRDNYLTQADADGRFSIAGVTPGTYECVASRAGFAAQPPEQFATTAAIPPITVANGQRVTDVVLRLTPLGVITGRVLDAEGYPVSFAGVFALQYGYQQGKKVLIEKGLAQSDDRGEYRIFDLFPGAYFLRASRPVYGVVRMAQPSLAFAATYYPNALASAQAMPVEVAAAGEARSVDIHLQPLKVFSIRGKLPAAGALGRGRNVVILARKRPADPESSGEIYGYPNGPDTWEMQGLPLGSYTLRLAGADPVPNVRQVALAYVDIVDADVDGVELSFAAEPEISGVVKPAGTAAVALDSLRVALLPADEGQQFISRVKADGTFPAIDVFPGIYRIAVEPETAVYPKSIKLGDRELAGRQVDLTSGGGGALAIVVAGDFGKVHGAVTDAGGNPAAAHNVTLIPDQTRADWQSWFKETLTDAQGRFAISGVAPGRYTVFAWKDAPRGAPQNAEFRQPFEQLGLPVTVEPASAQTVNLKAIVTQPPVERQ